MRQQTIVHLKDFKVKSSRFNFLKSNYKKGKILDIGNVGGLYGGEGVNFSAHLSFVEYAKDSLVYGFDLYPPTHDKDKYNNQKTGNVEEELPYQNNEFDTVYLGELIEHVSNPGKVLSEINRILKKDGVLIIDTPNAYNFKKLIKYLLQREENLGDPTHVILFTPGSLTSLLRENGFRIDLMGEKNGGLFSKSITKGLGSHILVKATKL